MYRSFSLLAVAAALAVNAVFAASSWPQQGYDAQQTNFNRSETALSSSTVRTLHVAWRVPAIIRMIAGGSAVYAITAGSNSEIVSINPRTGNRMQSFSSFQLGLPAGTTDLPQALALWNGQLIVGTTRHVVDVNPATRKILWRVPGGADQLVISGHFLYTGKGCQNACGSIASQGINLQTGRLMWSHNGNFGHAPVLIGNHLYQSWGESQNGYTKVYDPASGHLLAIMPAYGTWTGDTHHTFVYTVTGRTLTRAQAALKSIGPDGRAVWAAPLGRVGDGNLVYAYGSIFTGSYRFSPGMVAVNASNGTVRWAANLGQYLHLAAANHLLVAANDQTGQVSVLNAGSGKMLRQFTLPNSPHAVSGLAIAGGTIYVTDASGLTAIRP